MMVKLLVLTHKRIIGIVIMVIPVVKPITIINIDNDGAMMIVLIVIATLILMIYTSFEIINYQRI